MLIVLLVISSTVFAAAVAAILRDGGNREPEAGAEPAAAPSASPAPAVSTPEPEAAKTIYLTFDDGPYENTAELLDILDEYGVKATFFVTCTYEDYKDLIGEEFRRGHAVGIHAYRHVYSEVYRDEGSFIEGMEKMQEIIKEQTGEETKLYRFPGGSSNTVSGNLMPELIDIIAEDSLVYFDWDVDAHDATDAKDKETVLSYLRSGLEESKEYSVVLCHDLYPYTVDAMRVFIPWALENGYIFDKLSTEGPEVHHMLAEENR